MNQWIKTGVLIISFLAFSVSVHALDIKSINLTQVGQYQYDASPAGTESTAAQQAVDYIYSLGARHVVLTPEARMLGGSVSVISPSTPPGAARSQERQRYLRLINYIHSKGMTVGIRPIILVQNSTGGTGNSSWHGNIKPSDVPAWFESLRTYLDIYVPIAKVGKVEEFTIGAELYSMTVGLEDQWPEQPFGFPREWRILFKNVRGKLDAATRIMYDINYTDLRANGDGTGASGGEFERWRYRLVDLKPDPSRPATITPENKAAWENLRDLWKEIDVAGIDVYRSLLSKNEAVPADYDQLVTKLEAQALQHATDIDTKLLEIENALGFSKRVILKEIGFKSCTACFIDPGLYDDPKLAVNIMHQAAAYQAAFNAYVKPQWAWLQGLSLWDVSVNPYRSGEHDPGFSPRGKGLTEEVIRSSW